MAASPAHPGQHVAMGGAQRTQHPVVAQQGHGEGSWALPSAAAQMKEWDFLPKAGLGRTGWRCQGVTQLQGVAGSQGTPHALTLPLLSISHCEPQGTILQ